MGIAPSTCQDPDWLEKVAAFTKPLATRGKSPSSCMTEIQYLIETYKEDILNRFHEIMLNDGRYDRMALLKKIFCKFATWPGRWSVFDLTRVLSIWFPEPSTQLIRDAAPTLYRLLLCAGSFPYHQAPPKELDLTTLMVGVRMLLDYMSYLHRTDESTDEEELKIMRQTDYSWLLFQCLAPSSTVQLYEPEEDNTKDVAQALMVLSARSRIRDRDFPKCMIRAAPLSPPETFACIRPRSPNEYLPNASIHAFVRLVLACQLQSDPLETEYICSPDQLLIAGGSKLDEVANAVIATFNLDKLGNCSWPDFQRGMSQIIPGVSLAFQRILSPLICDYHLINSNVFDSLSLDEATELLHRAYTHSGVDIQISSGFLSLPRLAQLSIFLPERFELCCTSIKYPENKKEQSVKRFQTNIRKSSNPCVILVSGSSSNTKEQFLGGIYLPVPSGNLGVYQHEQQEEMPVIFQCEPQYRVFRGTIDVSKSSFAGDLPKKGGLTFRINMASGEHVEAYIDPQLCESSFTFPANKGRDRCDIKNISIEKLEDECLPDTSDKSSDDGTDEQ